jgi:hypothetical protein
MATYQFGKAFTVTYYPSDREGDAIRASADAPTIYLFGPDTKPGRDAIIAGTGSIETVNSWTKNGTGYDITFSAVEDPSPEGQDNTRDFYIGINFTLETGEQSQARLLHLLVSRPLGFDNELRVTSCDIEKYFHTVDDWMTNSQQGAFVDEAIRWVRGRLRDSGYRISKMQNVEDLETAVIQRTINRIAMSLIADGNTGFLELKEDSASEADKALVRLEAIIDIDEDGDEDTTIVSLTPGYAVIVR